MVGTTGLFGSSFGNRPSPEGAAGAVPLAAGAVLIIDVTPDLWLANIVRATDVAKKHAAKIAVARVKVLPTPRDENKLPEPPPMPNAPPSERCNITRPIKAKATIRWMVKRTVCM